MFIEADYRLNEGGEIMPKRDVKTVVVKSQPKGKGMGDPKKSIGIPYKKKTKNDPYAKKHFK